MKSKAAIRRPVLSRQARYRWDTLRQQHQIVFPEGVLVLNESAAAIVQHCDGRSTGDLIAVLKSQFTDGNQAAEVHAFLGRLADKGLLREAADCRLRDSGECLP